MLRAAQLLSGIGTGATVSIGSILAVELSGSTAWAGAVATVMTLGAALAALPLAGTGRTAGAAAPARSRAFSRRWPGRCC